jgi:hypothetical protein
MMLMFFTYRKEEKEDRLLWNERLSSFYWDILPTVLSLDN